MGPAPKPAGERRRRNATIATTKLPAEGRKGPAPVWPLLDDITLTERRNTAQRQLDEVELQLMEPDLTSRQRAAAKRKLDAAQTAVNLLSAQLEAQRRVEAELWTELWATPQAVAWERLGWTREVAQYVRWKAKAEQGDLDASKEARQLADRLGLSPLAMLRLRWEVAEDEVSERRERKAPAAARRRLKVIDPDVAGG
jgi:hypothetical protein